MTPEQIQQLIAAHMPDATVEVSGGEGKLGPGLAISG
jgi:acid stress-induced BolA-like protein IbaG/YrbA